MINFGSVYLVVKDFNKSLDFYKKLFERDVESQNMDRFAAFSVDGLWLCLLNGYFDVKNPDKVIYKGETFAEYDDMVSIAEAENSRKIVINLGTPDLREEYERVLSLGIGTDVTKVRYMSAGTPYYYFSMKDPDGNIIEITGRYTLQDGEI